MTMIDPVILLVLIALIFGTGFMFGLMLAGRVLLSRMHRDDVEDAHKKYRQRKEKYL